MITNEEYMELKVLRKHRLSLREISAQTGMAVNTVRKYLEGGPPAMKKLPERKSKLDPFKDYLAGRIQAAKPDWIPATVLQREIAAQGYTGSVRILQEYLKELRPQARPDPVVRFETQPGEQMQMDWIEFRKSGHKDGMLAAFVATLGHSRATFAEFVTDMKLETLLACHVRAFESFGGVTREVLYDNMKTVILKRDAYGKNLHQFQGAFADFAHHHGFVPRVCKPYRAKTKGKVERMNGYIRRSFWVPLVASMKQQCLVVDADTANREMRTWLRDVANVRIHGTTGCVPALALQQERTHLLAIPSAYSGRTVRQLQKVTGSGAAVRPIPAAAWRGLQHPLAMYDTLVHNQASAGGRP
ncbi:IS21 family transposase [Rhodoferax potami]|uniref:IS21 family transposase n=1 Tax=Rhodoferax potami TaxID=3068338 RepID=UPI003D1662D8